MRMLKNLMTWMILSCLSPTICGAGSAVNITADRSDYATWPSVVVTADGTQWVAWQEYSATADANKLFARPVVGGVPGVTVPLTAQWGAYLAPKVAVDGQGRIWFVWPGKDGNNWDLWARYRDGSGLSNTIRVTDGAKPEFHPALAVDHLGRLWIAYEDFNGSQIAIRLRMRDANTWSEPLTMSHADANGYSPSMAVDDAGRVWVAWYSFRDSSYDVYARYVENGSLSSIIQISQTNGFDEYPVVAPALQGGVWIAWRNGQMGGTLADLYGFTWYKEVFIRRADGASLTPVLQVPTTDLLIDPQIHGPTAFALARAGNKMLLYVRQPDTATLGSDPIRWAVRGLLFDGTKWSQAFAPSPGAPGYHQQMGVAVNSDGTTVSVAWQADDRAIASLPDGRSDISLATSSVDQLGACTRNSLSLRPNTDWPHYDSHIGPRRSVTYQGTTYNVYFGDLHCHTDNSLDGQSRNGMYDTNLRRVRDLAHLDFICLTDHDFHLTPHDWNEERKWIDMYNQLDGFTAFEGYEWTQEDELVSTGYGHRNVVYRGSGNPWYRRGDVASPLTLWSLLTVGNALTIPHHPASSVHPMDWNYHSDDFQRVVEIFQTRKNQEYHDAPRVGPDSIQPLPGQPEPPEYVHSALARGLRFGFIASPDHQGYNGAAAVLAPACTRDDLMDAMFARRTYAVSNAKFFCDFRVNGHLMGEEYELIDGPAEIYVHLIAGPGFGSLYQVDVFRVDQGGAVGNQAIIHTRSASGTEVEFTYTDASPPSVSCAYYVRALQVGINSSQPEMVWSSPVFAVLHPGPPVIAPILPDPDIARASSEYVRQMTLTQGPPPVTWSLPQGPAGAQVNASGRVYGWTPGTGDLGHTLNFMARAENTYGAHTQAWHVWVISQADFDHDGDVDQEDFGKFQACLSGPRVICAPGCEEADLDSDRNVDVDDFRQFQRCMGGANQPPGC